MNQINSGKATCLVMLCILAALLGSTASAGVLVMKNGDRITGTVSQIYDSKVTIEPAYADKFSVNAADIDYIESERDFEA